MKTSKQRFLHKLGEQIQFSDRKKRNLFLTFNDEIKLLRACQTEDVDTCEHSSLSRSTLALGSAN